MTWIRLFSFLFSLLPSRDSGPAVPLHGPTLYHMIRDRRAASPQGRCSLVTQYFPHLVSPHMPTPMTPLATL